MCSSQTSIHDDAESISPHDLTTKAEPTKVLKQPELPTRQHYGCVCVCVSHTYSLKSNYFKCCQVNRWWVAGHTDWFTANYLTVDFMDEGQRELRLLVHHLHWLSVILKYEKNNMWNITSWNLLLCHECTSSTWNWCWVYTEVYERNRS